MLCPVELVDLTTLPPATHLLSERELAFFSTLKLPKRQTEWLGGRVALKKLVAAHIRIPFKKIEILPHAETGKPQLLIGGEKSLLPFSITHSHGLAAAAIAPDHLYVGIDLEKTAHRIDAWKQDFFHPSELTGEGDDFLTALWTQKEAVVKLLGTGLAVNSFEVRCIEKKPFFFGRAQKIYESLGTPEIVLDTCALVDGFQFSVAVGNIRK